MIYKMELLLDEEDYRDIQKEIAQYQASSHKNFGSLIIPDGESNLAGAIIGEAVRSLWEYRQMFDAEHGKEPA